MSYIFLLRILIMHVNISITLKRDKRSLYEFGRMIAILTRRNPMDYENYGNWCGIGGSGETVDNIDKCCKTHDECYHSHDNHKDCKSTFVNIRSYITRYRWSYNRARKNIICNRRNRKCQQILCVCDRNAAYCLARHKYNPKHKKSRFG